MPDAKSPAACAEFPNDNQSLHRGAIWTCAEPCEPATVDRPPAGRLPSRSDRRADEAGEFADQDAWADDIEVVEELSFEGEVFEEVPALIRPRPVDPAAAWVAVPESAAPISVAVADSTAALENARDLEAPAEAGVDPYEVLVNRIAEVVLAAGGGVTAEAGVRWLLGPSDSSLQDANGLAPGAVGALAAGTHVEVNAGTLRRGEAFGRATAAWRGILRGETDDFVACGSKMLDEWSADLVARLLGDPLRAPGLRQELRRRGVAAFGLLDAGSGANR